MRKSLSLLVLMTAVGMSLAAPATAPRVEADPNRNYPIFPEAGNWMVLVAYYTGPEAPMLAKQMVYKIRSGNNWPAYVFEYVDQDRQRQADELERANKMARKLMEESGTTPVNLRMKTIRVEKQYGVLIGGWNDRESAELAAKAIREPTRRRCHMFNRPYQGWLRPIPAWRWCGTIKVSRSWMNGNSRSTSAFGSTRFRRRL